MALNIPHSTCARQRGAPSLTTRSQCASRFTDTASPRHRANDFASLSETSGVVLASLALGRALEVWAVKRLVPHQSP